MCMHVKEARCSGRTGLFGVSWRTLPPFPLCLCHFVSFHAMLWSYLYMRNAVCHVRWISICCAVAQNRMIWAQFFSSLWHTEQRCIKYEFNVFVHMFPVQNLKHLSTRTMLSTIVHFYTIPFFPSLPFAFYRVIRNRYTFRAFVPAFNYFPSLKIHILRVRILSVFILFLLCFALHCCARTIRTAYACMFLMLVLGRFREHLYSL